MEPTIFHAPLSMEPIILSRGTLLGPRAMWKTLLETRGGQKPLPNLSQILAHLLPI